jgi:hypothetical protein
MTPELLELKKEIIDGMYSFMKYGGADDENDPEYDPEYDAGYTQKHIDQCSKIIDEFFSALANIPNLKKNESILKSVKAAVVKLNKLNDKCDSSIIETDQREQLCELIITAANHAGLESNVDDVTEEWREW